MNEIKNKKEGFKPMVFEIIGSKGNKYLISEYTEGVFVCGCPHFVYKSRDSQGKPIKDFECKHIHELKLKLGVV